MSFRQVDNFIKILQAALGGELQPLEQPDWDTLVRYAKAQSLMAVFYQGAVKCPEFVLYPEDKRVELQRKTIATVTMQTLRTRRFLSVYQQLTAGGVHPIVLKGILCRQLYGALADYRPSCDEDLYIPPKEIITCHRLLEQAGWKLESHPDSLTVAEKLQVISYQDTQYILHVEIHPTFFGTGNRRQALQNQYFLRSVKHTVSVPVDGITLESLDPTAHYLYLFFHFAKHLCDAGAGIRQILDMMLFQNKYQAEIRWDEVQKCIRKLSSPGLYADVTTIGRYLGFSPKPLFREVNPQQLLEDIFDGGVFGQARSAHGRGSILTIAAQYESTTKRWQRLFFPSVQQLEDGRPWLSGRPWLLPIAWMQRAGRLFHGDGKRSRVTLKSLREAHGRTKLLRSYDLVYKNDAPNERKED